MSYDVILLVLIFIVFLSFITAFIFANPYKRLFNGYVDWMVVKCSLVIFAISLISSAFVQTLREHDNDKKLLETYKQRIYYCDGKAIEGEVFYIHLKDEYKPYNSIEYFKNDKREMKQCNLISYEAKE